MPLQTWISGTTGVVAINSTVYPANSWEWLTSAGHSPLPTVSSMPFIDMQTGAKQMIFRASGTAAQGFNPFLTPAAKPYLNTYCSIGVTGINVVGLPLTGATCAAALISEWSYRDEADGMCTWQVTAYGSWIFANMNNTTL